MANYPSKTSMPIAVSNTSRFNLSGQHITTTNFMEFGIAKYLYVRPGQTIPTKHTAFALFDTIATPTMGRAKLHHKCFFVPYRTIFPAFDDMITDTVHYYADGTSGHPTRFPYVMMSTLRQLFVGSRVYTVVVTDDTISDDNVDIVFLRSDRSKVRYNLTPLGRRAMKILNSCGIRVSFNEFASDIPVNILILLAVIKVYMDFYFPSAYIQDEIAADVYAYTTRDVNDNDMEYFKRPEQLHEIFQVINKVNYDNDFFANVWDQPSGPNVGAYTDISINDVTTDEGEVYTDTVNNSYNTPVAQGVVSHYLLKTLQSVSDYFKRHQLVGSRALDRFLARFGIVLSAEKLKRSVLIDDYVQDVQFGEIMSTADTDGANLGSRAGRGHSYDNGYVDYKTKDYGIVLWITTVVPRHGYYQGLDRHCLAMTKLDFFTPEFDAQGVQAVSPLELFVPFNGEKEFSRDNREMGDFRAFDPMDKVFGFGSRYYEDKIGTDNVTGDFVLGSKNSGLQGYHLMRDMSQVFDSDGYDTVHDSYFVEGSDSNQYNRIFFNSSNDYDHIKLFHNFEIDSVAPGKRLYDTYEFENENVSQHLSIDVNGVKAN